MTKRGYGEILDEVSRKALEICGGLPSLLDATGLRLPKGFGLDNIMRQYEVWLEIDPKYRFTATPHLDSEGFVMHDAKCFGCGPDEMCSRSGYCEHRNLMIGG